MNAKVISGQTPSGQRKCLAEKLPLNTPYLVQIFPVYACNFKCNYCVFSVPKHGRGYLSDEKFLDFALFRKCVDDIAMFADSIKMLRFAGTGEPLLHPDLAKMIEYAATKGIAESIDVVTNGSLLSNKMSEDLVSAGLSRIRISIQGVTREKYKNVTGNYSDIEQIVSNVSYLYKIREKTEVYVKIISSAMDNAGEQQLFEEMFSPIADIISVENIIPATHLIDYSTISTVASMQKTQNSAPLTEADVCPQPFYMLQVNPDGMVVPCCAMESPLTLGNISDVSVCDIWFGKAINDFRIKHLKKLRCTNKVCRLCQQFKYAMLPDDYLDSDAERLQRFFNNGEGYPI